MRRLVISQVTQALAGRGRLTIGRFSGGLGGAFVLDSVTLADARGVVVLQAAHVELDVDLAPIARGRIRVRRLLLVRPFALFEQGHDSVWNVSRLFGSPTPTTKVAIPIAQPAPEVAEWSVMARPTDTRVDSRSFFVIP